MTKDKLLAALQYLADLARQDGWDISIVPARNLTNPEEIVLFTVRFGKVEQVEDAPDPNPRPHRRHARR